MAPRAWRVEVTDADGNGFCAVTIFAGFEAEESAREYANWLRSRQQGLMSSKGHGRPA